MLLFSDMVAKLKFKQRLHAWIAYKKQLRATNLGAYIVAEIVETIVVALPIALFIKAYFIQTSVVPTGSMIPTLNIGDRLFVNKMPYYYRNPKRGEIVVFGSPFGDGKEYVKRLVGLPGDRLKYQNGRVYINDEVLFFPGVYIDRDFTFTEEQVIPEGQYFVSGDNRANSLDSRMWGYVSRDNIRGYAFFTFWPLNRLRFLR